MKTTLIKNKLIFTFLLCSFSPSILCMQRNSRTQDEQRLRALAQEFVAVNAKRFTLDDKIVALMQITQKLGQRKSATTGDQFDIVAPLTFKTPAAQLFAQKYNVLICQPYITIEQSMQAIEQAQASENEEVKRIGEIIATKLAMTLSLQNTRAIQNTFDQLSRELYSKHVMPDNPKNSSSFIRYLIYLQASRKKVDKINKETEKANQELLKQATEKIKYVNSFETRFALFLTVQQAEQENLKKQQHRLQTLNNAWLKKLEEFAKEE